MKRIVLSAIVGSTAFISASAANVVNVDVPLTLSLQAPCSAEVVDLSGSAHLTLRVTQDAAGGLHGGLHLNLNAQGLGETSGIKYVGGAVLNGDLNFNQNGGGNVTVVVNAKLNTAGSADNFKLKLDLHLTATPNGDITAEFLKGDLSCN